MVLLSRRILHVVLCGLALLASSACRHASEVTFRPDPALDYSLGWFHEVERGETLTAIGAYYQRSVPVLAHLNDLDSPYSLHPKMHLYIPPDDSEGILANPVMTLDRIRLARIYHDKRVGLPGNSDDVPRKYASIDKTVSADGPALPPSAPDATARLAKAGDPRAKSKVPTTADVRAARHAPIKATAASAPRTNPLTVAPPSRTSYRSLQMPLKSAFRLARPFTSNGLTTTHVGVDLACPTGTPIYAAADGVVLSSSEFGSYGNMVLVDHGDGFASLYGHNSANLVHEGDRIKAGQQIARVGATGRATGPHVHFELRYNGVAVDPTPYLPPVANAMKTVASR